jgi:hypothetical protein
MFDTNPDPASGRHSLLSILAGMLAVRAIGVGANAVGDAVGSKLGALPLVGGWVSEYGSPLVRNVVGVGAAWLLASRTRAGFSEGVQLGALGVTAGAAVQVAEFLGTAPPGAPAWGKGVGEILLGVSSPRGWREGS